MNQPDEEVIQFHFEDIDFDFSHEDLIRQWIIHTISQEQKNLGNLNFIFCTDPYLHKINIEYLDHDTFTDIITFPYSEEKIEGDIFISIDRIHENAKTFGVSFTDELHRVIIHGVLHLIGYGDKSPEEKKQMTAKEDQYLTQLTQL